MNLSSEGHRFYLNIYQVRDENSAFHNSQEECFQQGKMQRKIAHKSPKGYVLWTSLRNNAHGRVLETTSICPLHDLSPADGGIHAQSSHTFSLFISNIQQYYYYLASIIY